VSQTGPRHRLIKFSKHRDITMAKNYKKKGAKKSTKPRGKRIPRAPRSGVPEWASISCKRTLSGDSPSGNFSINQLYNLMNVQLSDFPRAVNTAKSFQHYRIKQVSVTFKPTFDNASAGGTASKMRLYYMIDKSGSIPTNVTLDGLKQMGARPRELDERAVVISWAPSVLMDAMFANPATSAPARYSLSPWLTTKNTVVTPGVFNPSTVDHLGLYWYCDQLLSPYRSEYQIEVEVQFQFKKPLIDLIAGQPAVVARFAELDDSPDGTTNTNYIGSASFGSST